MSNSARAQLADAHRPQHFTAARHVSRGAPGQNASPRRTRRGVYQVSTLHIAGAVTALEHRAPGAGGKVQDGDLRDVEAALRRGNREQHIAAARQPHWIHVIGFAALGIGRGSVRSPARRWPTPAEARSARRRLRTRSCRQTPTPPRVMARPWSAASTAVRLRSETFFKTKLFSTYPNHRPSGDANMPLMYAAVVRIGGRLERVQRPDEDLAGIAADVAQRAAVRGEHEVAICSRQMNGRRMILRTTAGTGAGRRASQNAADGRRAPPARQRAATASRAR